VHNPDWDPKSSNGNLRKKKTEISISARDEKNAVRLRGGGTDGSGSKGKKGLRVKEEKTLFLAFGYLQAAAPSIKSQSEDCTRYFEGGIGLRTGGRPLDGERGAENRVRLRTTVIKKREKVPRPETRKKKTCWAEGTLLVVVPKPGVRRGVSPILHILTNKRITLGRWRTKRIGNFIGVPSEGLAGPEGEPWCSLSYHPRPGKLPVREKES